LDIETAKQGSQQNYDSQAASSQQSLNAMIAKIMKVRPQDPSCMA
jgi:hypothetical protein